MTFLTFDEWCSQNQDLADQFIADSIECVMCNGDGWKECGECGHETECPDCDDGRITKPTSMQVKDYMRTLYDQQRASDAEKLVAWTQAIQELTA